MFLTFRKYTAAVLAACFLTMPLTVPVEASWGGIGASVLKGAVEMGMIREQLRELDENGQEEVLANAKEQSGYYDNAAYQERAQRILDSLVKSGVPKRKYVIFVNPSDDINAYCTLAAVLSVNKGTLDVLDDQQLAFVLAHEVSHGEHRDIVNGVTKKLSLAVAGSAVLSGGDSSAVQTLLMNLGLNYINNEVFTMGQEKAADDLGFTILEKTDYNLGGAPAAMHALLKEYGSGFKDGIARVIAPNSHPRNESRVTEAVNRMQAYSGNRVTVKGADVIVNDKTVLTPVKVGNYDAETRAYYVAGRLARLVRDHKMQPARLDGGAIYVGSQSLYTLSSGEDGHAIVNRLNAALTPEAKAKEVKTDTSSKKIKQTAETKPTQDIKKATPKKASEGNIKDRVNAILGRKN
ncbi:MAG: M48 family metallopeptidase [Negativicoccus succinicivorans]|nr:M48 family metallopeptidase [Negativicoccus succinicivorans]